MWNMPATTPPRPMAATMKPSWEIVEYASTPLMSLTVVPIVAANSAVKVPTDGDHRQDLGLIRG